MPNDSRDGAEGWVCELQELQEQKNELLQKVQVLKTDLQDWRTKLESQVKSYKTVRPRHHSSCAIQSSSSQKQWLAVGPLEPGLTPCGASLAM
jgi:chromosome segregation ATPase